MKIQELLSQYEEKYLPYIIDIARSKSCIKALGSILSGDVDLLTRQTLLDYRAKRHSAGLKHNSINKELKTLGSALRWGRGEKLCSVEIAIPKTKEVIRPLSLSIEQVQKLINSCDDLRGKCYIALLFATAQRKMAVTKLLRSQIIDGVIEFDQDGAFMAERRKARARTPVTAEIQSIFDKLEEAYGKTKYILSGDGGFGYCRRLDSMFKSACEVAGIKATAHTLRHTAATVALASGASLWHASSLLGHSSTAYTEKVYVKRKPEHVAGLVAVLGGAVTI